MVRFECEITEHENGRVYLDARVLEGVGSASPTKREQFAAEEASKALKLALITCEKFTDVVDETSVQQEGQQDGE